MTSDLTRTLAGIALGPKAAAPRKDPPYDGRYALDWEGVQMSVPYWLTNERDLGTERGEVLAELPLQVHARLGGELAGDLEPLCDRAHETPP